jgi:3' exoribonuclease family, domain 2
MRNLLIWRYLQFVAPTLIPCTCPVINKPHALLSHIRLFTDPETPPILDPSQLEATLRSGTMTLAMTDQRELCVVQKAGLVLMAVDEILRLVGMGALCSIWKPFSHVSRGWRAEGERAGVARGRGTAGGLERALCRGLVIPPLFGTFRVDTRCAFFSKGTAA